MPTLKAEERPCETCGKLFRPYRQQVEKGNGRFCSRGCRAETQRVAPVELICQRCGKGFARKPGALAQSPGKFCSAKCRSDARANRVATTCGVCGKPISIARAKNDRNHGRNYCSRECGGIGRRQGPAHEPTVWRRQQGEYKAWRRAVLERDNYTCQECNWRGKKDGKGLSAHHIRAWSRFPELRFDVGNGRTLCRPCHTRAHAPHLVAQEPSVPINPSSKSV